MTLYYSTGTRRFETYQVPLAHDNGLLLLLQQRTDRLELARAPEGRATPVSQAMPTEAWGRNYEAATSLVEPASS